jgi:hypothetical protein
LRGWDYRKDVTPGSCVKDEEKTPKRGIQRRDFFEDFSSGEMGISRVGKKPRHLFCGFEEKSRWFRSSLSCGFTQPSYVSAVLGFLKLAHPQILQTTKRLRVGKQIVEVVRYPAQGNTAFKGTLHGS